MLKYVKKRILVDSSAAGISFFFSNEKKKMNPRPLQSNQNSRMSTKSSE